MITLGTLWIICKILFPLFFWGFVLYNLPFILGAILTFALAILMSPIFLIIAIVRHRSEAAMGTRSSQNKEDYYQRTQQETVEPYVQPSKSKDLYDLLGVRYNASKAEIKAAFKSKMMMNHPDKLAALDPELQRIATQRTIAIKDAYERLSGLVS